MTRRLRAALLLGLAAAAILPAWSQGPSAPPSTLSSAAPSATASGTGPEGTDPAATVGRPFGKTIDPIVPPLRRVQPVTPPLPAGVVPAKPKAADAAGGRPSVRCTRGRTYDAAKSTCVKIVVARSAKAAAKKSR